MRLKKLLISLSTITLIILAILTIIINSKFIWKIFGSIFCENPNDINVYYVGNDMYSNSIVIKGSSKNIDKKYAGYKYLVKDGIMYVGLKYNLYWGYENKTVDFDINIPYKGTEKVKKVYLSNGRQQIKIWPSV